MNSAPTVQWFQKNVLPIPLGLIAGIAAGIASTWLVTLLSGIRPMWVGEALQGLIVASIWMTVGLLVAKRLPVAGPIIFIPGAALAWIACRAMVHSVSPYYGLFSFTACCAGAMAAWVIIAAGARQRYALFIAVALPLLVIAAGFHRALTAPSLGVMRRMTVESVPLAAYIAYGRSDWVWQDALSRLNSRDSVEVMLEEDPGSGSSPVRLIRLRSAADIRPACDMFRNTVLRQIEREIRDGSIPAFITRVPGRFANCESGSVWRVVRRQ